MNVIFFMMPIAFIIATFFVIAFIWSVKKGQYDDIETPSYRMLLDDEIEIPQNQIKNTIKNQKEKV